MKIFLMCSFFLLLLFCTINLYAQTEVGIMSFNTEWFWDHNEPHEGRVAVGPRGNPPTARAVNLEAFAIARIIIENNANIIGFIEVENKYVVDLIRSYLPEEDWTTVFLKGRDGITGQDVALLTKFGVISSTATEFGDSTGDYKPSKILGVGLNVGTETMYIITAHFISKRRNNDAKRLGQANFIRDEVIKIINNFDHVVVLGDLNDMPDSPPLRRLRGFDDTEPDFIQTAVTTGTDAAYSYIYQNEKQLIDHILLSPSLESDFNAASTDERHRTIDLGPISDHRAVIVNFELN